MAACGSDDNGGGGGGGTSSSGGGSADKVAVLLPDTKSSVRWETAGRGHVKAAVLGALVIASIANGLGLLGLSAGTRFVVTGLVLLAAVAVDSFSRRGRAQAGRA